VSEKFTTPPIVFAMEEEIIELKKKIDELEKKLAEAVELIDCTSDRWGNCKCKSCAFLDSLEEKEAQGE